MQNNYKKHACFPAFILVVFVNQLISNNFYYFSKQYLELKKCVSKLSDTAKMFLSSFEWASKFIFDQFLFIFWPMNQKSTFSDCFETLFPHPEYCFEYKKFYPKTIRLLERPQSILEQQQVCCHVSESKTNI